MKKILRNIALLLLPILLYYAVFIAFEPNNRFGLRAAPLRGNDIIARMRGFEDAPQNGVIIGDSRVANLDITLFEKCYGTGFANLASGGSSLTETLDMLDWTLAQNPGLEQVVLGLSYYTLNAGYSHDRKVVESMQNPFVYMTNLTYNINMLETVWLLLQNELLKARGEQPLELGGGEAETRDPATYEFVTAINPETGEEFTLRKDLLAYATGDVGEKGASWRLDTEVLARLCQTIEACRERGIGVTVVLPPLEDSVRRLVLKPNGIEGPMIGAVSGLRDAGALVLDYEFENPPAYGHEMFYDGFHLDYYSGLPVWSETLIEDIEAGGAATDAPTE